MTERPAIVYSNESSLRRPLRMLHDMFHDLARGRELAWRLAVRDINAQYRSALLGILWAFILPLGTTITWLFLSRSGIVEVGDTELPYAVYVFTGTMLWAIFVDALNAPLQQTTAAKPMLARINFPREALALSGLYQVLFNAGIKVILLLAAILLFQIPLNGLLLLFPLGVLSLILAGTTLGFLVTPFGVLYGDVGKALPVVSQFLMYLAPVVFAAPSLGWAARVVQLNPLTPLIVTTRGWLTGMPGGDLSYFLAVNAAMACLLLLVWIVFRAAMPMLIERMSA